ncbi:hypothetical protein F511_24049 [Dorcoceras hygrometricum]|uniref:Splicing factor 3B subunit 1-like n=1 Tax=Dorcoceras hygrometricum TaxID=472368 RepID=A0A2Z7AA02_9LAMI|nr:hypothetical protein F511_24049 [Dorcoceras hygrometricum]
MASSLIENAIQVNFEYVLGIPDNYAMVKMFRALESTGLRGFLGCPSVLYEKDLEQLFDIALVKDNEILCVIHGKVVVITEERFVGIFELPTEGLTDLLEVTKNLVFDSVTVKAGSFDAVTHERFVLMTVIHFEQKVNWSKLLFDTLKEMADESSKRAKGYATQICVLLKGDLAVILEEAKTFPPLKILSAKTVGTYVATNKTIDARGESDEPKVTKVAVVKRKSVSKKRFASAADKDTDEVPVEIVAQAAKNKRTSTGRSAHAEKDLELVTVAQDAVSIQIVEPISAVPAARPHAQKRKAPKRKLRLSTGSDDEIVEKEPCVENVVEKQKEQTNVDEIDNMEKAEAEAHTKQDQVFRDLIKSVKQEVQLQKTALSLEMIDFKKGVRAHSAIVTTDLADICKEEQYATLRDNFAELIEFFNRGHDDKKGEVGSSRGQPPPDDRSRPGGGGGSRNRSDQIVDRSYDEATVIGMNRMFICWTGPAPASTAPIFLPSPHGRRPSSTRRRAAAVDRVIGLVPITLTRRFRPCWKISIEPQTPRTANQPVEIIGPSSSGPSTITTQWSSGATTQSATSPMIALDLSGATTQSADHNASSTQKLKSTTSSSHNTSFQSSKLVSIERSRGDELIATNLAPNGGINRWQIGEIGFE